MDSLVKIYQGKETVHAVEGVNFEIREGEFVSIIGPSGSGKSTILRMIAGFEEPTEGQVVLDRIDITKRPPFDRDTNMMFQDLALFPNYTVSENIEYGPKQDGVSKKERQEMAAEMLDVVQLEGYGDRAIDELSGGEQQRVALARCMVNRPSVVLFDEPLASLDRQLRRQMTTELSDIQNRTGSTFLYVTHNQEVALSASDRVIVLNDGQIEQIGTPDELYHSPETEFVANFVGDMNMFSSDVREGSAPDNPAEIPSETITMPPGTGISDGATSMKVGIRPHDTELVTDREDVSDFYLEGTVRGVMFAGEEKIATVDTELGEFTAETNLDTDKGDTVFLSFGREDVHLFPTEVNNEH
ncbi:ABC transporter ATP-binding protein [Haloarcula sp. S1CR25-12]|uniref:Molybdate/tungstate import ATP-binding protein WtpC n=1 Tax=Haloarcula saliterrae TaxID=2950534 RepID=A0ABU2FHG0_9EURY|nr:ABC transporter ATP-binding protein [Haloarcula sp. S1CR25-12]MDS0261140.1 ABC transporter ATP-binding protein [Haloarcula sp. S1CR25-12]